MENRGYITITGLENKDEQPIVSVKIENGNVWMTKHELARLFGVFVQTIDANVRSIFKSRLQYTVDIRHQFVLSQKIYFSCFLVYLLFFPYLDHSHNFLQVPMTKHSGGSFFVPCLYNIY